MVVNVIGDENTLYAVGPNGELWAGSSAPQDGVERKIPKGYTELTKAEYDERFEANRAAREAWLAAQKAADEARQLSEYREMIEAGFPESVARRMSGYKGPALDSTE